MNTVRLWLSYVLNYYIKPVLALMIVFGVWLFAISAVVATFILPFLISILMPLAVIYIAYHLLVHGHL